MRMVPPAFLAFFLASCLIPSIVASGARPELNVDWKSFLSRSNPLWKWNGTSFQPVKWYHSAFIGNGEQGMMIRVNSSSPNNMLLFVVSSSAIWDDRMPGASYTSGNFALDRPRLPVGSFSITTVGKITDGAMTLDLYNGQVTGSVATEKGTVEFVALANSVYSKSDVMVVQAQLTGGEATRDGAVFEYTAKDAQSTWGSHDRSYVRNPPAKAVTVGTCKVSLQNHITGSAHATAYHEDQQNGLHSLTALLTMSISHVVKEGAADAACKEVTAATTAGFAAVQTMNSQWWNAYYPASFVTFTDTILESFYWVQMYKLASGTRADRRVYDLLGPWFIDGTNWPDLHWDLNIQLTYYPLYAANRLDIASSLTALLDDNIQNLINNVPAEYRNDSAAAPTGASADLCMETCYWDHGPNCTTSSPSVVGNLMWTLQLYYLQYRYSMDEGVATSLYPILRRAINYYTRIQFYENGKFHLPVTFSPEYPGNRSDDTNYDLALYRWGLETGIHLSQLLKIKEPNIVLWKKSLEDLTPYPVDSDGNYAIAANVPFNIGHRHFSHLFMVWPLSTIDWSDPTAVDVGRQSVDHWLNVSLHSGLTGFCRPPFAVMSMLFGRRSSVYTNLTYLVDNYVLPNTFYHEGENGECGETPPMAASALQDMMLYYWGGSVHVFAGMSKEDLPDGSFHQLRTEGGYLVSAVYKSGVTQWVFVEYDSGSAPQEELRIVTDMAWPLVADPPSITLSQNTDGSVTVHGLQSKGQTVMIYSSKAAKPGFAITPVPAQPQFVNYWGYHAKPHSTPPQAVAHFPAELSVMAHRNVPDVFTFHTTSGQCLAVDACSSSEAVGVVMMSCLKPGESLCSTFCDACQQNWVLYNSHLVSQATGQCVHFTGDGSEIKLAPCPFPVSESILHPEEPFPWQPPVHSAETIFTTFNATEFLMHNKIVQLHSRYRVAVASWTV